MKFDHLLDLVNEVPHTIIPDEMSIEPGLASIEAIDYCVEKWPISNDIKMSISQAIFEMSDNGLVPYKKGNNVMIHIIETGESIPFLEQEQSMRIIEGHNLDVGTFAIDFINNEHYFKYCTASGCFVRKKKSGSGFTEL